MEMANKYTLLNEAVEEACKKNPDLVLDPYYQMKQAALILARRVLALQAAESAAPEMYAALKGLLDCADEFAKRFGWTDNKPRDAARAALKKAEGAL
jgi:hypothetical protein